MSESIKAAREAELLPCPFCGEQVVYRGNQPNSYYKHYRECGRCLVRVLGYDTSHEADAAWNTRKVADEAVEKNRMKELAIAQFIGWREAESCLDIISLVSSMGLTRTEWRQIKPEVQWLPKKYRDEVDEHFKATGGNKG